MIKRILLAIAAIAVMAPLVFGASFEVKLAWDPNTEPDVKTYKVYRTDGVRALMGSVEHPLTTISINVTVPDGSEGAATFIATASDTTGNESGDSNQVARPFDYKAPGAVQNLR